jgi:hypothetical protein
MKFNIVCGEFKPMVRNTLRGFATITIEDIHLTVKDVAIHEKDNSRWAQLPSRPMLNRDGAALRDDTGKVKYVGILDFDGRDTRDRFSAAVIAAVLDAEPHAFDQAPF